MNDVIIDLFCCQGGASKGYADAGFTVIGVDIEPQPRYPFEFIQGDAIALLPKLVARYNPVAISGSPPCQRYSKTQRIMRNDHPDLITPTRSAMQATGLPWIIENVEDARDELRNPVMLCGLPLGLRTYRHRLFETSFPVVPPVHAVHWEKTVKMGRRLQQGDFYHAVGNFSNVDYVREDLGVPWMSRDGIRECIPPVYAESIGLQLLDHLDREKAA